jgi:hypothetical protein
MANTLNPQDPAAQALIAGQGLSVPTDPGAGLRTEASASSSSPLLTESDTNRTPMVEAPSGEGIQIQQGAASEPISAEAPKPPLPEPTPEVTPTVTPEVDTDFEAVESLQLSDIIDPQIIEGLKGQAFPQQKGWRGVVQSISEGLAAANAEWNQPGGGNAYRQGQEAKRMEAMKTLASLDQQLNLYKREAIRQRSVAKKATATQDAAMQKAQFQANAQAVREAMVNARKVGVVGPAPPTTEVMFKDPEAVQVWLGIMNELIAEKQSRMQVISQQLPMFEKLAKDGGQTPEQIKAAWFSVLSANGMSQVDIDQYWKAPGMMLESIARQAQNRNAAWVKERAARTADIGNRMKNRDKTAQRLDDIFMGGGAKNAQAAQTELRLLANQKLSVQKAIADAMLRKSVVSAALASGKEDIFSPDTLANIDSNLMELQTLENDLSQLEEQATMMMAQRFNAQRPEVAMYDIQGEAIGELVKTYPEFGQVFALDQMGGLGYSNSIKFLEDHKTDARVIAYRQGILNNAMRLPQGSRQGFIDRIDQQRQKILNKDSFMPTVPPPTGSQNAGKPAAGPTAAPAP